MDSARIAFDALWDSIHGSVRNTSSSAEQPAPKLNTACPHVASLLEAVSTDSLDWLVENFLWGKVSEYGLSHDGTIASSQDNGQTSADVKLELLIKFTGERREHFCTHPNVDILNEDALQSVLNHWKNDYTHWMHPQTLQRSWDYTQQRWHQTLRKSFRSFLFHLVGCYEMTIFFLVAPFTPDNLDLFQSAWVKSTTNQEALTLATHLVRTSQPVLYSPADAPAVSTSSKPSWGH
jgi:hypothetical protein